jgi:hypothetical protein
MGNHNLETKKRHAKKDLLSLLEKHFSFDLLEPRNVEKKFQRSLKRGPHSGDALPYPPPVDLRRWKIFVLRNEMKFTIALFFSESLPAYCFLF